MENLNIELDENRKISISGKVFNSITGTFIIIYSLSAIYNRIENGYEISKYYIFVLLIIFGVSILLYTFGFYYHLSRRYVSVDKKGVEYKLSYFYPSRIILWVNIKRIDIRILTIFFITKRGSSYRMKLGEIFYADIKKLKHHLASICIEKGIEWSDTTNYSQLSDRLDD